MSISFKNAYELICNLFYSNIDKNLEKKSLILCLKRGKIISLLIFLTSFYSFYTDYILSKTPYNALYKSTLFHIHIITFFLSFLYFILYIFSDKISKSNKYTYIKFVVISQIILSVFIANFTSLNSQRFSSNIIIYLFSIISISLLVPIYRGIVFFTFLVNQIIFLYAIPYFSENKALIYINRTNSTVVVVFAFTLFIILNNYNNKLYYKDIKIKEDKLTFRKLFDMNPFPLLVSSYSTGKILAINNKALMLYGMTSEQFKQMNYINLYKNISDVREVMKKINEAKSLNDYVAELSIPNGESKWAIINYELIEYFGEKAILSGISEITEIKKLEEKLILHASMDSLTGILNRGSGMKILNKKFEKCKKNSSNLTICFCDVDNLKFVNDKYGHKEGDFLISFICKIISEEINDNDMIFRYGGDEFIIIFENDNKEMVCQKIKNRLKDMNNKRTKPYPISVSLGLFSFASDMNYDLNEIIKLSDKKMYTDKLSNKKLYKLN